MTITTTIKHLRALAAHLEENDFSTPAQDRAVREAIAWLAGERRRQIRMDLREKVIDHIDGNPRNWKMSNLRIATRQENNR